MSTQTIPTLPSPIPLTAQSSSLPAPIPLNSQSAALPAPIPLSGSSTSPNGGQAPASLTAAPQPTQYELNPPSEFANTHMTVKAGPGPGFWDRIVAPIREGAIGHAFGWDYGAQNPSSNEIIAPEAAMTPVEQAKHPILTGVAETAGSLTTPGNISVMAATGGLGELGGLAGKVVPRLVSGGFSAAMIYGAAAKYPGIKKAIEAGDYSTAKNLITQAVLQAGLAGLGIRHAATGRGAVTGRTPAGPTEDVVPSESQFSEGDRQHLTKTYQDVLDNPDSTPEEKSIAAGQLKDLTPIEGRVASPEDRYQHPTPLTPDQLDDEQVKVRANHARISAQLLNEKGSNLTPSDVTKSLDEASEPPEMTYSPEELDELNRNPLPRVHVTFGEQQQIAAHLGMSNEDLARMQPGEGVNAGTIVRGNMLLNDSITKMNLAFEAAKFAAPDSPEMKAALDAVADHQVVAEGVKGKLFSEAVRNLAPDKTAMSIAEELSKMPDAAKAEAIKRYTAIPDDDVAARARFASTLKAATPDKIYEGWLNGLLSGGAVVKKAVFDTTMTLANPLAKLVGGDPRGAWNNILGVVSSWSDALDRFSSTFQNEMSPAHEANRNEFVPSRGAIEGGGAIEGEVGRVIRIPTRTLAAITDFFHVLHYGGSLAEQAANMARSEGLSGDEYASRVAELRANPTEPMSTKAHDYATEQTAMSNNAVTKALQGVRKPLGMPGKIAVPFTRTGPNIARMGVEYSPLGFFKPIYDAMRGGEFNHLKVGRAVLGTAAYGWAYYQASLGNISGAGPSNRDERLALEAAGWQPYSFKVGQHWISYRYWEPISPIISAAADTARFKNENPGADASSVMGAGLSAFGHESLDLIPFMYTLTNALDAFKTSNALAKFAGQEAGSIIPTLVSDIAKMTDRVVRTPKGFLDELEAKIPGLTKLVPALRAPSGEPIQRPKSSLGGLNPYPVSKQQDSTMNEMSRLGVPTPALQTHIVYHSQRVELTPAQSAELLQKERADLTAKVATFISSPAYKSMSDDDKRKEIARLTKTTNSFKGGATLGDLLDEKMKKGRAS